MSTRTALIISTALWGAALAHAHEGHGLPGLSHWHASDTAWALACLAAAAGLWFKLRK